MLCDVASASASLGAEEALRQAVVKLSAEQSVSQLSVSEVCREAGISRDSFYRFATSPADLLAQYLYDDHNVENVFPGGRSRQRKGNEIVAAMRLVVEHAQRNVEIYRNALDPHFPPQVQDALLRGFTRVLQAHVERFPDLLPELAVEDPTGSSTDAFISYVAFATLGAIESLVRTGAINNTELSVAVLRAAIAPSWLADE